MVKWLSKLRDLVFVDKARSEREYQRVKYCVDWCKALTGDHLYFPYTRLSYSDDPREILYDNLYDVPRLVQDFYEENKELKSKVKELEEINRALLENTKVVIIKETSV